MAGHNVNDERQRSVDVEFDRSLQFNSMFLSDPVVHGLSRNNFIHPSPIQARAIPLGKLGIDLLVQAKSGTGKTLVFAVLIAESHNPDITFPQSLTIVPTREIAVQIEKVLNRIAYSVPNFRAQSFIGGLDVSQDRKNLQSCSAVIGTPGRIYHLIKSNVLNTSHIKILVLDEADSLITGTLQSDVDHIIKSLPQKRQTVVCSATFYHNRDRLLLKYLNEKFIGVTPKKEVPVLHGIRQFVREMPETKDNIKEVMAKIAELNQILKKVPYNQCLVFTNTQTKADTYRSYLSRAGWAVDVIRGGQDQRVRLKTVENLKDFRCRILTATDVLARGIDAENVNLVINVDVPKDNSVYLHRIGRAGRFGTQAISITLLSSAKDSERFRKILYDIGGSDMFVYQLPTMAVEEIWNFDQYGEKYGKFCASKLEQEIREQGADKSLLETIQEVDSKTELDRKSSENLEDSLEEPKKQTGESILEADSIEQMLFEKSKSSNGLLESEPEERLERIIMLGDNATDDTIKTEGIENMLSDVHSMDNVEKIAEAEDIPRGLADAAAAGKNENDTLLNGNKTEKPITTEEAKFSQTETKISEMQLEVSNMPSVVDAVEAYWKNPESREVLFRAYIDDFSDDENEEVENDPAQNDTSFNELLVEDLDVKSNGIMEPAENATEDGDTNKTLQFGDDELQKVISASDGDQASSKVDQMFLAAMEKLQLEVDQCPIERKSVDQTQSKVDQIFLDAINKLEQDNLLTTEDVSEESSKNLPLGEGNNQLSTERLLLSTMAKLDSENDKSGKAPASADDLFYAAMSKLDFEEESIPNPIPSTATPTSEVSCSTPESCFTDSSFSSNTTKQVEVGSNFTTPNSRVQEIRGAAPAHQVSSSTSDNSSELSHTSDPAVPVRDQNCLPLEVNNDALFAKIMEQKEMEADQQQRPFQFSIDGCSLEVHDDPVSDRDINSRKGSVPDVVPCGITLDPSRLQNRPPSSIDERVAVGFDLNSNTCGSNDGSVFEHEEEAVVPQDQPPKRIRFQQDDLSLDLPSNGVAAARANQQIDQIEQDPLSAPPRTDATAATEDVEDASSYSSEYNSESSNSSFFDQREWDPEKMTEANPTVDEQRHQANRKHKSNRRSQNRTNLYHRTYANWSTQYWNQMTMIRDYARYSVYTRRNLCHNCQAQNSS
ncbi:probable ATP-dependent RNA helicase DDX20 [Topomyia yanbarensis]|uniref:probable ATP-dependent RNA helicase DDX20 n=1 Tax=Topomyia yanbarensis TaxID=2498891 RepID=UPI00273C5046|nr:probable ATP-dependent RNA helicase DDX20 [Topomyia yanbarensis]